MKSRKRLEEYFTLCIDVNFGREAACMLIEQYPDCLLMSLQVAVSIAQMSPPEREIEEGAGLRQKDSAYLI